MDNSVKHHYLPVFFQKGFTDEHERITVYDKKTDRYLLNQSPRGWFLEKNLNRAFRDGVVFNEWEQAVMARIDDRAAPVIENIRSKDVSTAWEELGQQEQLILLQFLNLLYWRHPDTSEEFLQLFDRLGVRSEYFAMADRIDWEKNHEGNVSRLYRGLFSDPEWVKFSKFMVPYSQGMIKELIYHQDHFRIYPIDRDPNWTFFLADRPVLVSQVRNDDDLLFESYVVPLSKRRLLMVGKQLPSFLDGTLVSLINGSMIQQAKRFVASSDISLLRFMVGKNKDIEKKENLPQIQSTMFRHIEWAAQYTEHSEFVKAFEERYGKFGNPGWP